MPGDEARSMTAGCVGYIRKPTIREHFQELCRPLLPDENRPESLNKIRTRKVPGIMVRRKRILIVDDEEQNRDLLQLFGILRVRIRDSYQW